MYKTEHVKIEQVFKLVQVHRVLYLIQTVMMEHAFNKRALRINLKTRLKDRTCV